ncbi:ATP-binding protein [Orenia marismortui]|uniref:ATP-binding protein n=1 Tax=Orenia marismortui TaxID=46469 RepID=UPI00036D401C|nr:ATP-binding protein [Orenia marismortui]
MRELSLHILDIIQNSISAKANLINLEIDEDLLNDRLVIKIKDNGSGMSKSLEQSVLDPFVTSRKTRKVGLGLPLFQAAAQRCEGDLKLDSTLGEGTEITVSFKHSHIDRAPLGDITGTLIAILSVNPEVDLVYKHYIGSKEFIFDTRLIKEEIDGININHPEVLLWIESYLAEGLEELRR